MLFDSAFTQTNNSDNYYVFGLTFNSYRIENSVVNRIKFQGKEHIDDLNLGWDSFKWRNHQPDIGRFFNVDPLSEKYLYNSPYSASCGTFIVIHPLVSQGSYLTERFKQSSIEYILRR